MKTADLLQALKTATYPEQFRFIMPFVFEWENVIGKSGKILVESDKSDPGGETYCGLDRRSHPRLDFAKATPQIICDTYLADYWNKFKCESYAVPLCDVVFNCVVNAGWGRAERILAATGSNAAKFLQAQDSFYRRLADARPKSAKYLDGWLNRLESLARKLNISFDK